MPSFCALLLTAPPPGLSAEHAGPLVKIDGREALLRSVELFLNRDNIQQVLISFDKTNEEDIKRKYANHLGFSGVKVAWSSNKWMDQLAAGAEKIAESITHVVLHDAARPAVPYGDIDALLEAAEKNDAVALTAPVRSTLVELDEGGGAVATHLPSQYAQLLTPQVYSKAKFLEIAKTKKEVHATQLKLLPGSPLNVRVGVGADASLAKALIGMMPKRKVKGPDNPFEEAQW
jgi:2-C-methyl-D-erythritol 4-phosphate cytidylyltransferase